MKYIDSEKLIAEIEMRKKQDITFRERNILVDIETCIASLQQEQPEVDLEREIIKYKVPFSDDREYLNEQTLDAIARHFYELGLNARGNE